MGKPLISIIVPIHNAERYLKACLESVIRQTWKPLEIILVDDGSQDASRSIIADYQARYSNVIALYQENSGVSRARNRGLEAASGRNILFCDSDDLLSPDFAAALVRVLEQEEADLGCCRFIEFAGNEKPVFSSAGQIQTLREADMYNAVVQREMCGGYVWNKVFRRSLIEQQPALRFREQLSVLEDELFVIEYLQRSQTMNVTSAQLYGYRIHQDSILHREFAPQKLTAILGWEEIFQIVSQRTVGKEVCAKVWNDLMLEYAVAYKKLLHHTFLDKVRWRKQIRNGFLQHRGMYALNKQWTPKERLYYQFLWISAAIIGRGENDNNEEKTDN